MNGWHRRFYKPSGQPEVPDQPRRSAGDATLWFFIALGAGVIVIFVGWAALSRLTIIAIARINGTSDMPITSGGLIAGCRAYYRRLAASSELD